MKKDATARLLNFCVDTEGEPVKLTLQTLMQTGFMGGGKGSGKTTGLKKLFEAAYEAGAQCGAIATLGKWWSLRISASGKRRGLANVYVFGGKYGDVQITRESGRTIARAVHSKRIHYIIDVEMMRKDDRQVLIADFLEELMMLRKRDDTKESSVLFLDEMQNIAPQKSRGESAERLKEVTCDFARECRNFSMGMWGSAQRVANVDKDYIGLVDALIVMRTTWSGDRDVFKKWVDEKGASRDEEDFTWVKRLRRLEKGQAYLHVPEQDIFLRVQILMTKTYDATKTAVVGEKVAKVGQLSRLDVKKLGTELATVVAESEANDPVKLKLKVKQLEEELSITKSAHEKSVAGRITNVAGAVVSAKTAKAEAKKTAKTLKAAQKNLTAMVARLRKHTERFDKIVAAVSAERDAMVQAQQVVVSELNNTRQALGLAQHTNVDRQRIGETREQWKQRMFPVHYGAKPEQVHAVLKSGRQASTRDLANIPRTHPLEAVGAKKFAAFKNGTLTPEKRAELGKEAVQTVEIVGKQKTMLSVLANGPLPRKELGAAIGQNPNSSFRAYVARLKAAGYVEEHGDELALAAERMGKVEGSADMSYGAILMRNADAVVGKQKDMLEALRVMETNAPGAVMTRAQLSERISQPQNSSFRAYVARLKRRGLLVEWNGGLSLAPILVRGLP